jgi:hypothetical protein
VRPDWKEKSTIIPFRELFPEAYAEQDKQMEKFKAKTEKEGERKRTG